MGGVSGDGEKRVDQRVTEEVESIGLEGCLDEKEVKDEC